MKNENIRALVKLNKEYYISIQKCVWCHEDAKHFANELSAKEYKISGLCQKCQDEVFGEGGDEL